MSTVTSDDDAQVLAVSMSAQGRKVDRDVVCCDGLRNGLRIKGALTVSCGCGCDGILSDFACLPVLVRAGGEWQCRLTQYGECPR